MVGEGALSIFSPSKGRFVKRSAQVYNTLMQRLNMVGLCLKTFLVVLVCGFFTSGCQTTPKIDWDSRVGQWTYNDVVKDMGPADKVETLSDGAKVAEWMVQKGTTVPRYEVIGYQDNYSYPYYPYSSQLGRTRYYEGYRADIHFPDRSVRMIFRPDGVLESVRYFNED